MEKNVEKLIAAAKKASRNAYSPYSKFPVGAAFEDLDGNIFSGCNVENLAFPSGICAEKTAISKGVSEKGPLSKVKTLVVYTPTQKLTTPCGDCRQVINEFAVPTTRIICVCDSDNTLDVLFTDLLPQSTVIDGLS